MKEKEFLICTAPDRKGDMVYFVNLGSRWWAMPALHMLRVILYIIEFIPYCFGVIPRRLSGCYFDANNDIAIYIAKPIKLLKTNLLLETCKIGSHAMYWNSQLSWAINESLKRKAT